MWTNGSGLFYQGDCQPGDRAATDAEIAAYRAAQVAATPPTTLQIVSTGSPGLSGTYAINPPIDDEITAEVVCIATTTMSGTAKFTNGLTTKLWPDAFGTGHTFSTAQFVPFALAVGQYVDALTTVLQSGSIAWPAQPITIP